MKIGEAKKIIGSLSFPSKMPSSGYGLPARACRTGAKLVNVPGSVCGGCYALKGTYKRGSVDVAQRRRLAGITHPQWADAMVAILLRLHRKPIRVDLGELGVRRQKQGLSRFIYNQPGFHRWHDSGDLQSVDHLRAICDIAARTPQIKHWLPTQELSMVQAFLAAGGTIPSNLVIRISSVMINDHKRRAWPNTSSVFSGPEMPSGAHVCPAPKQDHHCGACRACWSRDVAHIAYPLH